MSLHARNDIHLARRIWHFCGVMLILALYLLVPAQRRVLTNVLLTTLFVSMDIIRLFVPAINRTLSWIFRPLMRERERNQLAGLSYMLIGVTLVMLFLPGNVVRLTLLFLAVADPLASYFGIRFGHEKLVGDKTLQGTFAALIACFCLALGYFYVMDLMHERRFVVCLLAALIGAGSELLPVGKLDDNLVFPVVSGICLTGLFYLFGGL